MNKINPFTPINPQNLTDDQVGVQDGWRLCVEAERDNPPAGTQLYLSQGLWQPRVSNNRRLVGATYRTKAPLPEIPFPDGLPELPPAPEGHRWAYRGMGWKAKNVKIAFFHYALDGWATATSKPASALGYPNRHYAEAVPVEKPKVRRFRPAEGVFLDGVTEYVEIRGDRVFAVHTKLPPEREITETFPAPSVDERVNDEAWVEVPVDDHALHVSCHGCEDELIFRDPYAELKEAYRSGKPIQYKSNQGWVNLTGEPGWDLAPQFYRVKPDNERRSFVPHDDYSVLRAKCERFEKELARVNALIEKMREVLK